MTHLRSRVPHGQRLLCLTLCFLLVGPVLDVWANEGPPNIPIPRLSGDVAVDGFLNEAVWQQAAVLRSFTQYIPSDGRLAEDSTEVLVWYTDTAIYFGVRAFGDPASIRATLADRDKISGDDNIQIVLDTFNDQRQAFVIGVNPLGVQADGILRDASQRASMMGNSQGNRGYQIDLTPDFVYKSKGHLTSNGYEVEIQVPFKSLRYQSANAQDWGLNVLRRVQHSGYENTWTPVRQDAASFLAQSGTLNGLTNLRRGLVLDINPEITSGIDGSDGPNGWQYDGGTPELGTSVRWGITNNLSLTATVNPDFSQVEADAAQFQFDPRQALFFTEKRPFFLDGIELFNTITPLIYTRRVVDPVAAVKLTGKVSDTNVALLSAVDNKDVSALGKNQVYNMLRVRRDLKGQSTIGGLYTDFMEGSDFNRVAAVDGRLVFNSYALTFQGGGSMTETRGTRETAPFWNLLFNKSGRTSGFNFTFSGVHPDFQTASGFISRPGIANIFFTPRISRFGEEGALLENWTGSVSVLNTWAYERFQDGRLPNEAKLHFNSAFRLRGGWNISTSFLLESFKYAPELYTNYFVERRDDGGAVVDTVAYVGTDRLSNYDFVLVLGTPRFQKFSSNLFFIAGRDENFFEWAPANILFFTWTTNWRPTEQIRVEFRYQHQQFNRPSNNSVVGMRRVPRLKVEYQLTRAIFLRLVGQYDANFRDDLRDNSRTDDPILIFDSSTGTYNRTSRIRRNALRVDWLFSYRPNPGTVVFLGYGSSLDEPETFRFRSLERLNDGFFLKLSYLFRV